MDNPRNNLFGPAEEQADIDPSTTTTFLEIAEQEPVDIGARIESFEIMADTIITEIYGCFDTKKTFKSAKEHIPTINELATVQCSQFLQIYQLMAQHPEDYSQDEAIDTLAHLFRENLQMINGTCKPLFGTCEEGCGAITYSYEGIRSEIASCFEEFDPEDLDLDTDTIYNIPNQEAVVRSRLSDMFSETVAPEIQRIVGHRPNEDRYKKFDLKDSMPRILSEVGKIALGTALGTAAAIILVQRKK